MTTEILFKQIKDIRKSVSIPLIIMGYFNPVLQYGVEAFCKKCQEIGIDGLILPDLPLDVYQEDYEATFKKYGLINVFLITPQTSDERIDQIDSASDGFIYMVSSASVTGSKSGFGQEQENYFERISAMNLKNPQIVGFGIKDEETFQQATKTAKGAIIGSAFIKHLTANSLIVPYIRFGSLFSRTTYLWKIKVDFRGCNRYAIYGLVRCFTAWFSFYTIR